MDATSEIGFLAAARAKIYQRALELAESAPKIEPKKPTEADAETKTTTKKAGGEDDLAGERIIMETLGLDIIGRTPRGEVEIYSEKHGESFLRAVSRLTMEDLQQICGPVGRERIHTARDEVPGQFHLSQVKAAIGLMSGFEKSRRKIGQGCWAGIDANRRPDGSIVLVGEGEGARWDGSKLEKITRPRVGGHVLDLHATIGWYDFDRLQKHLADYSQSHSSQAIDEAGDLFAKWFWIQDNVAPMLLTGLVMASWVQTLWSWRPLVSVIGPSDCGKSTLFETLESLFGDLSLLSSKSTEAGIRQAIRNTARIALCDEFESDNHRKKILELFRTASKGSKTLRGTVNQEGQEYGLRHIPWVTAVELHLAREPDRNRFIGLDLKRPPGAKRGALLLPSVPELENLGQRLLAIAIHNIGEARKMAAWLTSKRFEGIHGRLVESFAVPVAMLAVATGADNQKAVELLAHLLDGVATDQQTERDEVQLMADILESTIQLGRGETATVAQILSQADHGGWDALEQAGIAAVSSRLGRRSDVGERDGIFLAYDAVKRFLLQRTQWADQSIPQLLGRLPTAKRVQCRIAGRRPYGILIERKYIDKQFLDDETRDF